MILKRFIEIREGLVVNELEYLSAKHQPTSNSALTDVTARADGPWLGKFYDRQADTFSYPPKAFLEASKESIASGESVTLTWTTEHALSAKIDNGVGALAPLDGGSVKVSPTETSTYTLTARGAAGTPDAVATVTVTVN